MKKEKTTVNKLEMFDALMENIPDGIYFKDLKSRFIGISKSLIGRLKINNTDEALGKTDFDFFSKEHADKAFCDEQNIINTKVPLIKIEEKETYEGREDRWVLTTKMPLYGKKGKIIGTFGISRDITERKKAEGTLYKSENLLSKIFDILPVGLWLADKNGKLIRSNQKGREIWGAEPLVGQDQYGVFKARRLPSGEEIASDDWALACSINSGKTILDEMLEIDAFDGKKKIILNYTSPVLDEDGKVEAGVIVNLDITEQKIIQDALQESEEKYRTLVEKANESITILQDGTFIFANRKTYELIGKQEGDLEGKTFIDFVLPEDREWVASNHRKRMAGGALSNSFDFRIIGADSSPIWLSVSVTEIKYKGKPATLNLATDITERKNAEQRILHLSFHDHLTGLYNRRFFEEELNRLDTKRQLPLSFIMGDINGLKLINDVFGHNEGDYLLVKVAEILKKVCRSDDILARWGGDEFVLLLSKTSAQDSEEIVARIKKECKKTTRQKIPMSLSLGAATKEMSVQNIQAIIIDAESNMYRNKLAQKESSTSSVISALEQALYEKSNETKEHIDKVRDLAINLGKSVKLHASQLDEISLLASLHDIGKVAISETILAKEGKLTKQEWEVIKRHPEIGFNIASSSPQIAHIAKAILSCHENWDGSGYPLGIAGESIPVISRIILIADTYDVMTRGRIYKDPMSKDDEIKELKRCAGTQFDPILVDKFIEIISS